MRRKAVVGDAVSGAWITATRWAGGLACAVGFVAWSLWLGWRVTSSPLEVVSGVVLVLEVAALLVALVLTAALSLAPRVVASSSTAHRRSPDSLPDVLADLFGLDHLRSVEPHGADDSGEVARARRGLVLLDPRRVRAARSPVPTRRRLATAAWAVMAVEGMRRMLFVAVLVVILLTGRFPFDAPSGEMLSALLGAQLLIALGHWALSYGTLRPGVRLRWSMASVGAGLGDGASRTGLPIRWTATMATMVVLNLAVSLRGVSDRWTHGLGPMPRDERIITMGVSWWLVIVGFAALRILVKPSLGFYGATHRLEETSTRRLALGTTLAVAVVGFVAGVLPGGLPA